MGYRETILSDRPVVFWELGDGSNAVKSPDISGHGFTPTHVSVTYGNPGPYNQGVANGFTAGSTSRMSATGTTDAGDNMAYEIWVRRDTIGVLSAIMSTQTGGFLLRFNADNTIHMLRSQVVDALSTSLAISNTTNWNHIVCSNSAVVGRFIYVNGALRASTLGASTGFGSGGNVFVNVENDSGIFRDPGTQKLKNFAVYNYTLSPAQILNHFIVGSGL